MRTPFSRARGLSRVLGSAALFVAVALGAACDNTTDPDDLDFTIDPPSARLPVGGSQQLTAKGAPGPVAWSSSASASMSPGP